MIHFAIVLYKLWCTNGHCPQRSCVFIQHSLWIFTLWTKCIAPWDADLTNLAILIQWLQEWSRIIQIQMQSWILLMIWLRVGTVNLAEWSPSYIFLVTLNITASKCFVQGSPIMMHWVVGYIHSSYGPWCRFHQCFFGKIKEVFNFFQIR